MAQPLKLEFWSFSSATLFLSFIYYTPHELSRDAEQLGNKASPEMLLHDRSLPCGTGHKGHVLLILAWAQ
jgi:hypothetical protein